jgi:hypothetical protein
MKQRIAAVLLLAAALLAGDSAGAQGPNRAAPIYTEMRNSALSRTARDLDVTTRAGEVHAYGVVMDIDIDGATATIVAFVSGDASIYLSSGGGTIGGIGHPPVAAAARAAVASVSPAQLDGAALVTTYPRPNRGETRFYLLTTQGVRMAARATARLEAGDDLYSPLYAAGQAVITRFREVDGNDRRR